MFIKKSKTDKDKVDANIFQIPQRYILMKNILSMSKNVLKSHSYHLIKGSKTFTFLVN